MSPSLVSPVVNGAIVKDGKTTSSISEPVVLRVYCSTSGDSYKEVSFLIDWGDGETSEIDGFSGLEAQSLHSYQTFGVYQISVVCINRSRERSSLKTLPLWVEKSPERQKKLHRWRGLALPAVKERSVGIEQTEKFETTEYRMIGQYQEGAYEIFISGSAVGLLGAEFTISQPNKLYTAGRIIQASGGKLILDTGLNDSYTNAVIEVTQRILSGGAFVNVTPESSWFFPVANDEALVRSSMAICLGSRKGEILYEPEVGSNLYQVPFEQMDSITEEFMKMDVRDAAAWEPRATISDLKIAASGNGYVLSFNAQYSGGSQNSVFNESISLGSSQ